MAIEVLRGADHTYCQDFESSFTCLYVCVRGVIRAWGKVAIRWGSSACRKQSFESGKLETLGIPQMQKRDT